MNTPWATGWANWDEQANLRDITSLGMLGWLQIAVARIIDEHIMFGGGRIPVIAEQIGDYISDMQKLIGQGKMAVLVTTPDFRQERGNVWAATVRIQVNETPVVNRTSAGAITAQRACEVIMGHLRNREPKAGVWTAFRPSSVSVVQSNLAGAAYALTGVTRTIVKSI